MAFVQWVEVSLQDIANQALTLGTGLQNAAPGNKLTEPNNAIQYLLETAEGLADVAEKCKDL